MKTNRFHIAFAAVAAGVLGASTVFAGSAALGEGGDFVLTADPGETYTYSTAIGSCMRVVKRGDGEVELTAATSATIDSVVVEAGTLTIKDRLAVGSSASVTVESGATLWLKIPGLGQADMAFPASVTIAGKGVGNNGALRFTKTTAANGDNLVRNLTLSDDATIDVSSRWGVFRDYSKLDLAGHTLTRIGGDNWMLNTTMTAGTIINMEGEVTLQGKPVVPAGTTIVITNASTSQLSLYSLPSTASIKGTIQLSNGLKIKAAAGTTINRNHVGNVHLVGNGTLEATSASGTDATVMSVDGAFTSETGCDINVRGLGDIYLNGPVTIKGNVYKQYTPGTLYLNGATDIAYGKLFTCIDGTLAMTSTATRTMSLCIYGGTTSAYGSNSTVFMSDGRFNYRMLRVTNGGAAATATYRQTGGILEDYRADEWSDSPIIGDNSVHRGFFTLEGGDVRIKNTVHLAKGTGSYGVLRQSGGMFNVTKYGNNDALLCIGEKGRALFVQTGGTNDIGLVNNANDQVARVCMGTNGVATMTVSGTGTVFRTNGFQIGVTGGMSTNILNISDGGTFMANRFWRATGQAAASFSCVNADGGIMMPTYPWGWDAASSFARNPDHFVLWEKGLVVDTSENASRSTNGGDYSSIYFWLEAPTGNGVESVTLPASGAYTTAAYRGVTPIVFVDDTGWGASAYAEYDYATKKHTKVVVTSRGCNYSAGTRAYIESPDRSALYECVVEFSDNAGLCGPFVKRGAPELRLFATNTITGGIVVEQGVLKVGSNGVVPANTPVTVEHGATLDLDDKANIMVSTFSGGGTVTNGDVTVLSAVRAKCADLFSGKAAHFVRPLYLAADAVFEITDAENLSAYTGEERVVAITSLGGTISRKPTLRLTTSSGEPAGGEGSWTLRLSADRKTLTFGSRKGMMILVM